MTLSTTIARTSYPGTGSTGPFAYPFQIVKEQDLRVTRRSATGLETTLNWPADFTVTGVKNSSGGMITTTVAPLAGEMLVIRRAPALTQGMSIRNQGAYYPATIEDEIDLLVEQMQSLQDQLDRSFGLSETYDPATYSARVVPGAAGQALGWISPTQLGSLNIGSNVVALPGQGRTTSTLAQYLLTNAVYNAKDYGAIGDGASHLLSAFFGTLSAAQVVYPHATALTNEIDWAANQGAMNAANAAGGGVVLTPTGTYKHDQGITARRKVYWYGQGMGATNIQYTGAGQGFTATGTGDVWYSGISDLSLVTPGSGLPYFGTYGVRLTDVCVFSLERVQLSRWATSAVLFEGAVACLDLTVRECEIHENQQGITVGGSNVIVNHVWIAGSKIRASRAYNIYVPQDVRNWTMIGNNFEAGGEAGGAVAGLQFTFGEGVAIISNYFEVTAAVPAINITGIGVMNGVTIMGNNIHGTGVANGASAITFGLTGGAIYGLFCVANSLSAYQVGIESNGVQTGQLGPNAFPNGIGTKYKLTVSQETAKGLVIFDDTGPRGSGGFSADKGDADCTVVNGVSDKIVLYNTPITTSRAVTLSITNNAKDGDTVTVIRTAAATGAGVVNVNGGLKTLAAGQWADFVFDGANTQLWKLARFGSL